MARGTDLWAAEIVLALRKRNKDLKLICALPYEGFELRWSEHWQNLYRQILEEADLVKIVGKGYHPSIFQIRNKWMATAAPESSQSTTDSQEEQEIPSAMPTDILSPFVA